VLRADEESDLSAKLTSRRDSPLCGPICRAMVAGRGHLPSREAPMNRAALLALAGDAVLTVMDGFIKAMSDRLPTAQVAFLRFTFGSIFALVLVAVLRPGWPSPEVVRAHAMRSLLIVTTATSFFYALAKLPLAETIALSFISPLFVALFGALLLGERIDARVLLALAGGFAGMLLIAGGSLGAGPRSSEAMLGFAAILVSAVTYALSIVLLRQRAQRDPMVTILSFQNIGPALLLAAPAAATWVTPTWQELATFLGIGALAVTGHVMLISAFARAEAARLAPLHYWTLLWGVLIGFLAFGEVPTLTMLAGALLIVVATLNAQRR
jgi:S-adenosylmethionine uptake transporter